MTVVHRWLLAVALVMALLGAAACSPSTESRTTSAARRQERATSMPSDIASSTLTGRTRRRQSVMAVPSTRTGSSTNASHGPGPVPRRAGFSLMARHRCTDMPFPGPIITAYAMYQCWLGDWTEPGRGTTGLLLMLGYVPSSDNKRQVMVVGLVNSFVRWVYLRDGIGTATVKRFDRSCVVIAYARSTVRTYYEPFDRRTVQFCRSRP